MKQTDPGFFDRTVGNTLGVLACRHTWSGNLKRMWRYPKEAMRVLGIVFVCNDRADKRLYFSVCRRD